METIARRVFGGAHPFAMSIEGDLRCAQEVLAARETPRGDDDDEDGWETVSSEEAPTTAAATGQES